MQLTKTTTRAFAASLALVAAGGTIAGAAVFHLPILGLGRADAASAKVAPAPKPAAVAHKARRKVVVKTRYADVIVHVPAPSAPAAAASFSAPQSAGRSVQSVSSTAPHNSGRGYSQPVYSTTTSVSTAPTMGSHEHEGEHGDSHDSEDAPDAPEHEGNTTTTTAVQP